MASNPGHMPAGDRDEEKLLQPPLNCQLHKGTEEQSSGATVSHCQWHTDADAASLELSWSLASILQFSWLNLAALGVGLGTKSADLFEVGALSISKPPCACSEQSWVVCWPEGLWSLAAQSEINKEEDK